MSMCQEFVGATGDQIAALHAGTEDVSTFLAKHRGGPDALDVDKTWNAIHFLLTGTDDEAPLPGGFVYGGRDIGDEDFGYGPPRTLVPEEVAQIAALLEPLTDVELMKRWNVDTIAEAGVYAMGQDDEEDREYVSGHYAALRELVLRLAAQGMGMITLLF